MLSSCPFCDFEGERVSSHWELSSSCSHPKLSEHHKEILTGVLMGDGCIDTTASNPRMSCSNINKEYLDYLHNKFKIFSLGVKIDSTAQECVNRDIDSGFNVGAEVDNYSDIYRWRTRCSPELEQFKSWYSSGKKEFPEDIEITPTILKHWFCCDGHYYEKRSNNIISFGVSNERENKDKIESYFTDIAFERPNWDVKERSDGTLNASIYFSSSATDELFDYMGEPLPGFEYKWK